MTPPYTPLHLDWPDLHNARDLGGMPTGDGRRVRERALIRTDALERLTPDGVTLVTGYGVSRVVDLRRSAEAATGRHPFAGTPTYVSIPVQNPEDPDHEWMTLAQIYTTMLDLRPALFTRAVAAIADAPSGGVIVHCAGGKDRTGIVTAMALTVAGVEPEAIGADYAVTEMRSAAANAARLAAETDPAVREQMTRLMPTPASNMLAVLDHLDRKYGGVTSYLGANGMTDDQLSALRTRLVDERDS